MVIRARMRDKPLKSKLQMKWGKWGIIFLCWTALALIFTGQIYIRQAWSSDKIEWKNPLIAELIWAYSWNLVTPPILRLLNRFPLQSGKLLRSIGIHALAAPFFFIASSAICVIAYRLILGPHPSAPGLFDSFRSLVISFFLYGLLIYWLIIGVSQAINYYRGYLDRELLASNLETRLVEAQLDALRMQLHPHFLFNAINSVSVLMRKDVDAADRMLLQLSNLLRVMLARNAAHEIKLKQELEILEQYLEIEQIRFQDRLTVRMQVDPSALDALVPQLFFQPLVENAIRHGVANREAGGVINIRAERQNGMLHLQVRDNGPGLNISNGGFIEGVGLSNTRSRLDRLYGSSGRFEVCNAEEGGLIVAAAFPVHTETIIEEVEAKR
jgi:two-component system, LytTR family, sensor kinase